MVRTQVYLTKDQERGLKQLATSSGRKQSELIRAAVDAYLAKEEPKDWKEALEAVRGMWADRDDLDELYADLRMDWDRRLKRLYGE
jgi:Arc/MetJ-type ribon-helix-helix transcriptional regulator